MTVRIFSAQIESCWEDPESSLLKAEGCIRQACELGAELICFPEQFATGWDPGSIRHVQTLDGRIITALREYAREYNIGILGALREQHEPHPRNTCVMINAKGGISAVYAKCHLFTPAKEQMTYDAGDGITTFHTGDMIFGIAICYDLRFSPLFRIYAQMGAHCVIVPAAWPASRVDHFELLIRARALDNRLYVVGVNTTGTTPIDRYNGSSIAADPDGRVISRGGEGEELIESLLFPDALQNAENRIPVEKDRRSDLYHRLLKE